MTADGVASEGAGGAGGAGAADGIGGSREPEPPGTVSRIRGRVQGPVLRVVTAVALALAAAGLVLPGSVGRACATAAVAVVTGAPLVRVAWLAFRWAQERDLRFVAAALGLLATVGVGALLTVLGIGT